MMPIAGPGWHPDPTGRHEHRYWDGSSWSDVVADQGVEYTDPLVGDLSVDQPEVGAVADSGASGRRIRRLAVGVWLVVLTLAGLLGGVVLARDDSDHLTSNQRGVSGRDALLDVADLPQGWVEAELQGASEAGLLCGQDPPEAPASTREANASFDRTHPQGVLAHDVLETTPEYADRFVERTIESAGACQSWVEEQNSGGTAYRATMTAEILNGPQLGDDTVWFKVRAAFDNGVNLEYVTCLYRHRGVLSILTISSTSPLADADRELVDALAFTVAENFAA